MLHQRGCDGVILWRRVKDTVLKTIIAMQAKVKENLRKHVKYRRNCYEMLEFKFLLDRNMKPWLLKVRQPKLECLSGVQVRQTLQVAMGMGMAGMKICLWETARM